MEALEISTEAVVKVLKANPNDDGAFQKIVEEYGAVDGKNTYQSLAQDSLLYPRYSFRVTISNLSKLIKKQWGSVVESLIFEKPRRKSSNTKSEVSSNSDNKQRTSLINTRDRLNSMDDIDRRTPGLHHFANPGAAPELNDGQGASVTCATTTADEANQELESFKASLNCASTGDPLSKKLNSIIQVDDPIDEKDEIIRDELLKKMNMNSEPKLKEAKVDL